MSWSDKYEPPEERTYLEAIANSRRGRMRGWLPGPVSATVALALVVVLALAIVGFALVP